MSALIAARRPTRWAVLTAVSVLALLALAALVELHGLAALSAAGLAGTAPGQGAGAFKTLVHTLKGNAEWLMATGLGLGFAVLALMFFLGSMRAPDYLLKIGGAVAIVLVVGPGVAS